jgi:decaprenylphospho-beta-D-erythro-pentofuranosid-2-ulose 2-reductase
MSSSKHYLILGATSGIAEATARLLAKDGHSLTLVARNETALKETADDLKIRGATAVHTITADLVNQNAHSDVFDEAENKISKLEGVLIFYGILGDQSAAEADLVHAQDIISANYTSTANWVLTSAKRLEKNGEGTLLAVSSVAGDRGRKSNFVYGSAKAGLSVMMQGLAHKWGGNKKLRAVNMKLGFVDTPMTADIEKGGPLWAAPEDIAKIICKALKTGGPNVYGPWFWRWIMLAIRITPSFVFNKVNL